MDELTDIIIRQASESNAQAIWAFLKPFFDDRLLLRRSEDEMRALAKHGFIATIDDQFIGFAAVEIYSRKLAEVQCLAIAEAYRSRGCGRQLVRRCVDRARELGIMEVMAISASEDFLKSCGFDYSLPDQKRALFCQLRPRE